MSSLKPRSALEWILTILAILLLVVLLRMAYYVYYPISWDGPGMYGVAALYFPFGFLYLGLIGIIALFWANRRGWRIFTGLMYLSVVIAWYLFFWPVMSLYKRAESLNVPLDMKAALWPAANQGDTTHRQTLQYGKSADSSALLLDYWPVAATSSDTLHPVILKIHGGGWVAGSRRDLTGWNSFFNSLGYIVFDVDYTMKGGALWKQEIADLQCALQWVRGQAKQYHIDTSRISVMGYSAGAHLAMMVGYLGADSVLASPCAEPPVPIKTVINFYGPTDLVLAYNTTGSPQYSHQVMGEYLGGQLAEYPDRYKLLSPITHMRAGGPPMICFYPEKDRIVPMNQGRVLDTVLSNVFVKHELYFMPGSDHGFDANWSNLGTQIARDKIRSFLQRFDAKPQP